MNKELDIAVAAVVFVTAGGIDALSTLYTRRCVEGKAVQAAFLSAGLLVLSSVTLYAFILNPWYGTAEVAGAAVGTYITVKLDSGKQITGTGGRIDRK